MNQKITFGIVSGAGPMAGALLYQKAIEKLQAEGCFKDADFPEILLYNYPFSNMLEGTLDKASIRSQLENTLMFLAQTVDVIYIACQTLHLFLPKARLKALKVVSLLDLVNVAVRPHNKLYVVASKTSCENKLHETYLKPLCECLDVTKSEAAIVSILKGKTPSLDWIEQASREYPVLLGCTEYSVALAKSTWNLIDPITLATNDLVRRFRVSLAKTTNEERGLGVV
ncbi:MAG: hypothetical protein K0U37_00160 [Gammaproteobacteria bacterium]|nr:hypothetical protein [Gammaproteobacteria bacterium]